MVVVGIIGLIICFVGIGRLNLFAENNELQLLCSELNDFKRYESKKAGLEETKSQSWEVGEKIVAYKEEAIPSLIDIYKNNDSLIAQLFAARLVAEIDFIKGKRLLENFRDDKRTIETIFGCQIDVMTISAVATKEIAILEGQRKKIESTQDHLKSKI